MNPVQAFPSVAVALLITGTVIPSALANDVRDERKKFVTESMNEQWDQVRKALARIPADGPSPMMIVSTVQPFGDWDYFVVRDAPIQWIPNPGQTQKGVKVPVGFVSDLASIPRAFWTVLRPTGRHAYAAIVHDYLYWTQERTREEADLIFRFALEDSKVEAAVVTALYQAVRQFGGSAWSNNRRLRGGGECRFISSMPEDFTISWEEWKIRPNVCAQALR